MTREELEKIAADAALAAKRAVPKGIEVVVLVADMRGASPGRRLVTVPMDCAASVPVDITYQIVAGMLGMPAFKAEAERLQAIGGGRQ